MTAFGSMRWPAIVIRRAPVPVLAIELVQPLAGGGAGMAGRSASHFSIRRKFISFASCSPRPWVRLYLARLRIRGHQGNAADIARDVAQGVHDQVDIRSLQRLRAQTFMKPRPGCGSAMSAWKSNPRGSGCGSSPGRRRIAERQDAATADADRLIAGWPVSTRRIDESVEIEVDIVAEIVVAAGPVRMANRRRRHRSPASIRLPRKDRSGWRSGRYSGRPGAVHPGTGGRLRAAALGLPQR